jgi:uncharacterized membrane protein
MLLMFPLGLFTMALLFDLATALGAPALIGTLAYWNVVAGLVGGLVAALIAGVDAFRARDPMVARIAFISLLMDFGVLILFAVLTLMRFRDPDRVIAPGLLIVEVAGLALAAFGAWYGGRFGDPYAPMVRLERRRTVPQA